VSFTLRAPRDQDLDALVALVRASEAENGDGATTSPDDILNEWGFPRFDRDRHQRVVEADGRLIAWVDLWVREGEAHAGGWVRTEHRGRGIGTALIDWSIEAARVEPDVLQMFTGSNIRREDAIALIEGYGGFEYARSFFQMIHRSPGDASAPDWPEGVALARLDGEELARASVEAHDGSFIDHWNYHPVPIEDYVHWLRHPDTDPDMWFIARADDGAVAGFCLCFVERAAETGRRIGWVAQLGTTRPFRRIGLGRALLRHGLRVLAERGVDEVRLGVDAENLSGALGFYTRAGFEVMRESRVYRLKL